MTAGKGLNNYEGIEAPRHGSWRQEEHSVTRGNGELSRSKWKGEGGSVLGTVREADGMGIIDHLRSTADLRLHPVGKKVILETCTRL